MFKEFPAWKVNSGGDQEVQVFFAGCLLFIINVTGVGQGKYFTSTF